MTKLRKEVEITPNDCQDTGIEFCIKGVWVMKITESGKIEFNRKDWPELDADGFSKAVIGILEKHFWVNLKEKK